MIKVPIMAIRPDLITLNEETFSISNFLKTEAFVKLKVGQSKIKLNDLKNLEKDDIVLLEESQASVMTLVYRGVEKEIKLQTNTEIMLNDEFDVDGANSKGEEYMGNDIYNMWDSIQVEIGAEFEKVKLSLGELKQISEGLVVDICSVYDNKIDLKVEEKKVASGELVIINDRYGVRINEVFTVEPELGTDNTDNENFDNNNENLDDEAFDENFEDENSEENQEISEEDAFDYSDFDVDDEDI